MSVAAYNLGTAVGTWAAGLTLGSSHGATGPPRSARSSPHSSTLSEPRATFRPRPRSRVHRAPPSPGRPLVGRLPLPGVQVPPPTPSRLPNCVWPTTQSPPRRSSRSTGPTGDGEDGGPPPRVGARASPHTRRSCSHPAPHKAIVLGGHGPRAPHGRSPLLHPRRPAARSLDKGPGRRTGGASRGNVPLTEPGTLLTEVRTLLTVSAGTFPGRSHQLQPLVEPQPSQT
jgi:hypothetical protein